MIVKPIGNSEIMIVGVQSTSSTYLEGGCPWTTRGFQLGKAAP